MIQYTKQVLSNGLKVIHHHDTTTPFTMVNILYNVGAKHEDAHLTGFAHLFEHLMFGGTKSFPNFDHPIQQAGGSNNAFTNNDYTNYYDFLPKQNVEIGLCLEANRMHQLDINERSLSVQQKVVIEEFKENYLNQPYGNAWHLLRPMVYEKHSYSWPTIGKNIEQIENAKLIDVQQFYKDFYQPNNAIVVLGGNIEATNAFDLAEKWFGNIASNKIRNVSIQNETEQTEAKTLTVHEAVPLNAIYLAFRMPERKNKLYYVADIITDILSTGSASRLVQQLVKIEKAFVSIDAYISGSIDEGMFVIQGKVANDYDVNKAYDLIWKEIEKLQQHLIETEELNKIKNKLLTHINFSDYSLMNRVISLAFSELIDDIDLVNKETEIYHNITPEDIQNYATQFLTKAKSNTLYYLKK
ncbi:MAG: pitrilysin family protein [Chitinophagales bacterium]